MRTLAVLAVALALLVPGSRFPVPGSGVLVRGSGFAVRGSQGTVAARFHHVHYRVADPAAAMTEAAARLGGTRQVVSGLGVGVDRGDVYVLYDRLEESDPAEHAQRPLADAYDAAVRWLQGKGIVVGVGGVEKVSGAPTARYHHLAFAVSAFDEAVARAGAPLTRREDSAIFDAGEVLVEIVRDTDLPDAFWCPMHPDVRSGTAGTCRLCAMDLVPIPPPKVGEYKVDVVVLRTRTGASGVRLTVRDPETNALVDTFETIHEKTVHLFVISRDLEYFAHVHPLAQKDGSFLLKHPLPPGEYMLFADFLPVGGTSQMVQRALLIGSRSNVLDLPRSTVRELSPAEVVVDGVRVSLKTEDLAAGKDACLTFTVTDATTRRPVTDLEPFLGAPAHMLMVRADLGDAVHAHPEEVHTSGPTVSFHPLIPAAGDYKLWIQFKRAGREITASFTLRAAGY